MKKRAETTIEISIPKQQLRLRHGGGGVKSFPVSTSRFGVGTAEGSFKTPTGLFRISEKIGEGLPPGTIFKAREPLPAGAKPPATDDLILTRILWLDGLDVENANTHERFIYIHGTRHEDKIGQPASHGCIRMRTGDLLEVFDAAVVGTRVTITA